MPYRDKERQLEYAREFYARGGSPGEHQVYSLLSPDRKPRYVGVSVSAATRMKTHWSQRQRRETPLAAWLRTLDDRPELWLIETVAAELGLQAEAYWIGLLSQIPGVGLLNVHRKLRSPRKGRLIGEAHKDTPLTEADVRAIRTSGDKQQVLADRYGISQPAVSKIVARKTWVHVE